jgi:short-subunit dehydrogenase
VIVTGGSSGIGRAIVSRIHEHAPNLPVFNLSRTPPPPGSIQGNLTHVTCDLTQPAAIEQVAEGLRRLMPREGRMLLVNNSGFGSYGEFPAPGVARNLEMIDLNVRAVVHLTGLLWPDLRARGGVVANVASLAGYQPTPLMTTYAATKAFVLNWSVALDAEARPYGVRCVAICPGPVSTNFSKAAGFASSTGLGGQSAEACAEEALDAMAAGAPERVTGLRHRLLSVLSARLPKPWAAAIGLRMIRRLRLDRLLKPAD